MTARRRVLYAAAAAAGVLAAGCAAVPPAPAVVISGRLAVVVAAHAGEPARQLAGSFELRGDAQRGQLDLVSPLGVTIARARWAPDRVELDAAEGPIAYASLDELTDRTFGEPMPVAALFDWLRGRPRGGSPARAPVPPRAGRGSA